MKTIGIKLADGSFYPVLEEGNPQTKKLELTTANNNQTKVMVDLYRSTTCSMDDAEYVDSLQIENLIAHPNGEAEIAFTVSIDENNQLDAQIVDTETGNSSSAEKIQLVSRTIEERLSTDEFGINESDEPEFTETEVSEEDIANAEEGEPEITETEVAEPEATEEAEEEDSNAGVVAAAVAGGAVAGAGLMAMANAINQKQKEEAESADETIVEDEGIASYDTIEDDFDTNELFEDQGESIFDDIETDDTNAEEIKFNDTDSEETVTDDILSDDTLSLDDPLTLDDDTIEDTEFDDVFADTTDAAETTVTSDSDQTIVSDNSDFGSDMIGFDDSDTIFGDMTAPDAFDTSSDDTITEDIFADMNLDDVNLDNMGLDDMDFNNDSEMPAAGGISFTGLYDKETEMGGASYDDADDTKKKTKVPVIICLICAIICIVAVILILFVIPSPCNVLKNKTNKNNTEVVEAPVEETIVEEPVIEEEPAVPEAKEDEIIVIEQAEEVVPVQPEPAVTKPENIVYKIKWGDTLWDIAGTYYKNPWKYKYIARYNGIKNPDYIISGTKIIIPAE